MWEAVNRPTSGGSIPAPSTLKRDEGQGVWDRPGHARPDAARGVLTLTGQDNERTLAAAQERRKKPRITALTSRLDWPCRI